VFPDILIVYFISRISADPDIKNSEICLPIMLGAKNHSKGNILCLKGNILWQIFFVSKMFKNHKLNSQKSIDMVIITTDYNFEKTSKNMSPEQFKIV
jgi:hypothetical protein